MKQVLLAATILCGVVSGVRAAPVTYTLVNQVYDQFTIDSRATFASFSFTVSDAAVSRGSFSYSVLGGNGFTVANGTQPSGDVADFISLFGVGETIDPPSNRLHGPLTASASFGSNGEILSSSFRLLGIFNDFAFGGSSASFGGTYGGAAFTCGGPLTPCRVSGSLAMTGFTPSTAVPEPASIALLAFGTFGVAVARRRVQQAA